MTDKTTKVLLFVIAIALWGLLLRPVVAPTAAYAQQGPLAMNIAEVGGQPIRIGVDGTVRGLGPSGLKLEFRLVK